MSDSVVGLASSVLSLQALFCDPLLRRLKVMASISQAAEVRTRIQVQGIVQGVGFRPFVFNLVKRLGLRGFVLNSTSGVEIELEGEQTAIQQFLKA